MISSVVVRMHNPVVRYCPLAVVTGMHVLVARPCRLAHRPQNGAKLGRE